MVARVIITVVTLLSMLLPHCHCAAADCCNMADGCRDSARDCCQSETGHSHDLDPVHQHSGSDCCCAPDHDSVPLPSNETSLRSLIEVASVGLGMDLPEVDNGLSSRLVERTRRGLVARLECQKVLCRWTC